ncbi:MAG: M14 family zinc carboxypeptidase, partial [Comamonas sp.]
MTKPHALVFAPYLERPGHAIATHAPRWLLASSVLALAACSSTPLPEWPASNHSTARTQLPSTSALPRTAATSSVASVTPIASNRHVQALPYNAAVAALFPDPNERYSTPGLADHRRSFTTNSELADWLRSLDQHPANNSSRLGVIASGNAQSGTPIYAVIATQAKAITPLALDESKRPTVMIVAGQQGTDAAATEAVLVLTKELATGGLLAPLLDKINIVLVPRANPDGFDKGIATTADGTDLRFDHLALKTPEARFLAKLARDYRPSMLLDAGEFDAIEPTLQQFAAVRANDVGLQYGISPN